MNISYNWLRDLIDIELPVGELAEKLTRVGLAVEGVHPVGDDFVLDIDLTSNRPDCLSHLGVAREISVITGNNFPTKTQSREEDELNVPFPSLLAADVVKVVDAELCPRFTARIIKNVKVGQSPEWLVKRLESLGERSINNVADITNYVLLELGQPMHAFDLDKLAENRIVVRRAKSGETITTLDEVERELDDTMLAICDANKPVAVAGVMGGIRSSITTATVNVLLEVAYFKSENIRSTSRKLNLATEASYRFERGVDIENLQRASDRAVELIEQLCGGEADQFVDVYSTIREPRSVVAPDISAAVERLTGMDVTTERSDQILAALGISRNENDEYFVPSWRHDLAIEEDLVEEVARHAGYENIGDELPPAFGAGEYQTGEQRKRLMRQSLTGIGFDECLSYSFIDREHDDSFDLVPGLANGDGEARFVTLRDSVIEGAVRMRPTLLPGLLDAIRLNLSQQRRDLKLFEIGKVFANRESESGLPVERELLALALCGGEVLSGRALPIRDLDFYDAKGSLEAVLESMGISDPAFSAADFSHLQRGQAASVSIGTREIGSLGRLNDEIARHYKFKQPLYVAEIDLQAALEQPSEAAIYHPLSKYPAVSRDVSFIVERNISLASITRAASASGVELCKKIEFVDSFEGKGIDESQRSLTIRFEYRSDERTLTDDEANAAHAAMLENLENTLGVKPRF